MRRGACALLALALMLAAADSRAQRPAAAQPEPQPAQQQASPLGLAGEDNNKPVNIEADNGIEWQQSNKVYIARGNAKATRGDNTITADTLYAFYRDTQPPPAATGAAPALRGTPPGTGPASGGAASATQSPLDNGSTQVYRIEADGHVVFATPTQTAYGDHAIYDVDQSVLVVTGKNLKIVTPQDIVTARDSLEWYDQKQIGVARGDAVAVRQGPEHKSIRGDVLTAQVTKPPNQPSKISKVDAQGHVLLVSDDQIARGDSGVYNLDTGIATLSGHVTLTRGENELTGQYAVVDTNTNVARLLAAPPSARLTGAAPARVSGLLIPRQQDEAALSGKPTAPAPNAPPTTAQPH